MAALRLRQIQAFHLTSLTIPVLPPLRQVMRRMRLGRRWEWWCWTILIVAATTAMGAASVVYDRAKDKLDHANSQLEVVKAANAKKQGIERPAPVTDFTQSMGSPPSAARVVEELKQASASANASVVSIQSQEHAAAVDRLAMLELTVVLKGSYTSSKQVLAQVVERFPFATVPRLRLRRGQAPADVETTVTFVFWGAPMVSSDNGSR